ncbi:MAG: BACON domain-containing protein [Ktedonobacterales bacterium]
MMSDYRDDLPSDGLSDEYAALDDAREVMREVIGLIEELRGSAKKLGDAIAAAGFPAREWVGPDAALALLGESFPDISLDAFLTRLAEFAAGMGPAWLRGGADEIARFSDEVQLLDGVARPLRIFAQRQRMLPASERGELPLERALGDGRVGTQLDLMAGYLRDLDALAPYIVPLTPSEWAALNPPSLAPSGPPQTSHLPSQARSPQQQQAQRPAPGSGVSAELPAVFSKQQWLLSSQPHPAAPASPPYAPPQDSVENTRTGDTPQTYTRLRDFAPPPSASAASPAGSSHVVVRVPNGRGLLALMLHHRWALLGITVLLLSAGTGLLSLVALRTNATAPTSHLTATPATLHLTCTGKGATATLTLRDTGKAPVTWTLQSPPAALRVSATHGTLKPGATAMLTATSTRRAASQGTLIFAADDGTLTVPYTISCP